MEKFVLSQLSFHLCSSCVCRLSRSLQSLVPRQGSPYFSTSTRFRTSLSRRSQDSLGVVKESPWYPNQRLGKLQERHQLMKLHMLPSLRLGNHATGARLYSTRIPDPGLKRPSSQKSRLSNVTWLISWKSLLLLASAGVVILLAVQYLKQQKELELKKSQNRIIGKAKLGGDWMLTDHFGNKRSSQEFRGQWLLIYFGFTHCPDVCPEELEKIVGVIKKTDANPELPKIQPVIITVDPERDTPEALKEYCSEFSPRLLGFTGTPEEIHQATHAYRVYFSAGPKDDDNDYIVDHSIISYLVNPEGQFVDYFGQNKTINEIYSSIEFSIRLYQRNHKSS